MMDSILRLANYVQTAETKILCLDIMTNLLSTEQGKHEVIAASQETIEVFLFY